MIYIESKFLGAAFNLAAEEYITRIFSLKSDEPVFMFWQTEKCVIIGRNQIAAAEIDLHAANSLGIDIIRRPSGGGAVFSDPGNIMYTLVTPFYESDDPKNIERRLFAEPIAEALIKMGIPADLKGRNDITANGKKFSGLAQYAVKNRLCSHGSMLFDSDLDILGRVLVPDFEKINSKALRSVRARVVNLCDYFNPKISVFEFLKRLKSCLFEKIKPEIYEFSKYDTEQINIIKAEKYENPEWLLGTSPKFSFHHSKRFSAGKIEVFLDAERGIIKSCKFFGDFLGVLPVEEFENTLKGLPYDLKTLSGVFSNADLQLYFGGIKPDELLECLFKKKN